MNSSTGLQIPCIRVMNRIAIESSALSSQVVVNAM